MRAPIERTEETVGAQDHQRSTHQACRPGSVEDREPLGLLLRVDRSADRVDHRLDDAVSEPCAEGRHVEHRVVRREGRADARGRLQTERGDHRQLVASAIDHEAEQDHRHCDRPQRRAEDLSDLGLRQAELRSVDALFRNAEGEADARCSEGKEAGPEEQTLLAGGEVNGAAGLGHAFLSRGVQEDPGLSCRRKGTSPTAKRV